MAVDMVTLQQNCLSLLLFDDEFAPSVVGMLPKTAWVGRYELSTFVSSMYDYVDLYKEAPKHHAKEVIQRLPLGDDQKKILDLMVQTAQSHYQKMNVEWVMHTLRDFYRTSRTKLLSTQLSELVNGGRLDEADHLITSHTTEELKQFSPGTTILESLLRLQDADALQSMRNYITTGILGLDFRMIVPQRKKMFTVLGPAKGHKTNFMIYLATRGLLQGKSTSHITLEVDKDVINLRYHQAFRSVAKRSSELRDTMNVNGVYGPSRFDTYSATRVRPALDQDGVLQQEIQYMRKSSIIENHWTAQFPASRFSISDYRRFLDQLAKVGITPDVVVLDYVAIMNVKGNDRVSGLRDLCHQVRQEAVDRNHMLITAWQSTRTAQKENKRLEKTDAGESAGIYEATDIMVSLAPQTDLEIAMGLMRIYVAVNRDGEAGTEILLSQNIGIGQFCLNSVELNAAVRQEYADFIESNKDKV